MWLVVDTPNRTRGLLIRTDGLGAPTRARERAVAVEAVTTAAISADVLVVKKKKSFFYFYCTCAMYAEHISNCWRVVTDNVKIEKRVVFCTDDTRKNYVFF